MPHRDLPKVRKVGGIDLIDPEVKARIEALRDSGQKVYLYGTLLGSVPDCNGSQILVDRIEVNG